MKQRKFFITSFYVALFCLLVWPASLMADEHNQATKMSFNEPVEIPGQVLPAGTYWFALMDSQADRNIVQIWNEDRSQLIATTFTVPDYRLQPTDKTTITFDEKPGEQHEAIQAWFYPGEDYGHEFVYPKTRALALARQTQQPVLSMPDEAATNTAPVSEPSIDAVTASGNEIEVSEIVQSEEPKEDVVMASLPQTASLFPIVGLLGLATLGASLYFRRMARKIA